MYLLTQLWWFLATACILGLGAGLVVRKALLQRRLDAVHRGALVEQERHAQVLAALADGHVQALTTQADALRQQLEQAHAQSLADELRAQAQSLDETHQLTMRRAHDEWTASLKSHAHLQERARQALERAATHIVDQAARHEEQRAMSEGDHHAALTDLAALQEELAQWKFRLEEISAQRDQAALRLAQAQAELGSLRHDQALADQQRQSVQDQEQALARAQQESALLREQLDVALIELSAAARARDAREAQRAQLAQQLALANDVRDREARIAAEQREQLMQRLMALRHSAQDKEARQTELEAQLAASRRTTQAAVLAGHQREARLIAELAVLRRELETARQPDAPGRGAPAANEMAA